MIETERLRLREVAERDVAGIVEAQENGFKGKFAIADRISDELYGVVTIEAGQDRAELGYWLKSSAAGRGYMSEAVAALLAETRRALPGVTLFATIDPENAASERVLVKNGFKSKGSYPLEKPRKRGTADILLFELDL
jgi:ribosomal-protein-alanine N-acetyltransferase